MSVNATPATIRSHTGFKQSTEVIILEPTKSTSENFEQCVLSQMKPPQRGFAEVLDPEVPGLRIRLSKRGKRSYVIAYRVARKHRRLKIGDGNMPLALARDLARSAIEQIRIGIDPKSDRHVLWV